MFSAYKKVAVLVIFGAAALISGCGGGGGSSVASTTPFTTTVIDGPIQNALVCLDKNANGACDSGEPQGRTDVTGSVTFDIAVADAGKYPVLAVVGTDATDRDTGAVPTPFTMAAPADKTAVVSPLTTLVQQTVASTGVSSTAAATTIQNALGLNVSVFQNYAALGVSPPSTGTNPATVARLIVVTTQQQQVVFDTAAADTSTINQAAVDTAIQQQLLAPAQLAALNTGANSPAVTNAANPAALTTALSAAATALVAAAPAITPTTVPTAVVASASFSLAGFNFINVNNFYARFLASTLAQATPDANSNVKYVDRRYGNVSGAVAKWNVGDEPWKQARLAWTGSAWTACALDFENTASVRDAQGNGTYSYCNRETGTSSRTTTDVSGQSMLGVYNSNITAGYTNLTILNAPTVLGASTFPTGSKLFLQTNTPLTTAFTYYPSSSYLPGSGDVVSQYSAAAAAGGTASAQAAGVGCNSAEWNTSGTNATTLEAMAAVKPGSPCIFGQGSFTYMGTTYNSGTTNQAWGPSTVGLGTLGSVALNAGVAPGYYSGNTKFRVGFTGTGNGVNYYACQERFNDGSTRNCSPIGAGTYTIATMGDGRVMTFNNQPSQRDTLSWDTVLVERNGLVYYGYKDKPAALAGQSARLNTVASTALLTQLGLSFPAGQTPLDPIQLTAGSYRGAYDIYNPSSPASSGMILYLNGDLTASCKDTTTGTSYACTVTFSNPATGAFTLVNGDTTASGTLTFMTGSGSGTFTGPNGSGNFVAQRR